MAKNCSIGLKMGVLHGAPKFFSGSNKGVSGVYGTQLTKIKKKSKISHRVWSREVSTFFKRVTHFGQNSRPGESDPYVISLLIASAFILKFKGGIISFVFLFFLTFPLYRPTANIIQCGNLCNYYITVTQVRPVVPFVSAIATRERFSDPTAQPLASQSYTYGEVTGHDTGI